ncbi:Endonuclease/Exonuclease/phosphatase family protein [Pricia antarctica]|uniref:Endonuclease/Exonuclease/phosphatase family protein n=1 Tax=Pricia antarctica TaxID=641691 RepID=A0A1G6YL82_9FLAO|nr:endonuclease/exonuclease/phosphatase family protein [Pricia antarctica]SDD91090.1 Endonuclease/Exonuclease/phosphatase family protein [Pricia antarctica]
MKIATFNIQNLFHRDRSLIAKPYGKCVTDWVNELDELMLGNNRVSNNTERIQELAFLLGFDKTFDVPYAVMRKRAGFLFLKGMDYSKELKSGELTDWNGWIALQTIPLDPMAVNNKAKVVAEVNPDIILLQEIEDRASLEEFNAQLLPESDGEPFQEVVVFQGSDKRGQEMGILLKNGYRVKSVRTRCFDLGDNPNPKKEFFQYEIDTPSLQTIWLLAAHLQEETKDKELSDALRKKEAQQIADVYNELWEKGERNIIVTGTLNAVSYCDSLSPLFRDTKMKDVTRHRSFKADNDEGRDAAYFRLGAYRLGVNIRQKDYLLLSPNLFSKVANSGLNRKAVWPDKKPMWSIYSSIHDKKQAASEHPAIWAKIDI